MHGLIHVILKQFIVSKFGDEKWCAILEELNVKDDSDILELRHYDDSVTVAGVSAAASTLGVSIDDALRAYGGYFVEFVHMGGHLRMLKSMGDDLHTFLNHINDLHHSLEKQFRSANFPIFFVGDLVRNIEGGKGAMSFTLSYCSARGDLVAALVEGILPELARQLHHQTASMVRLTEGETKNAAKNISIHVDAAWRVTTQEGGHKLGSADAISPEQRKTYGAGKYWHSMLTSMMTGGRRKTKSKDVRADTQAEAQQFRNDKLKKQLSVHDKVRVSLKWQKYSKINAQIGEGSSW